MRENPDPEATAELFESHWDSEPLFEPMRSDARFSEFTERLAAVVGNEQPAQTLH